MNISFNDKEMEILNGDEIKKQKELFKMKVDKFNGNHINDFTWLWNNATKNIKKSEKKVLQIYKRPKDDIDDEKKINNNNKKEEKESLSMLLDFKAAKTTKNVSDLSTGHGMCPKGDVWFEKEENGTCNQCGSKNKVRQCYDCHSRDKVKCFVCAECRESNFKALEYETAMDNIKREVIRAELLTKPSLSLDLLCALPRVSALEKLMKDINGLDVADKCKYAMFLIDMDNLKGLNSLLSHQGADEVIKNVGLTLKKWSEKVNKGKVKGLNKCFCFRQGGDEFCIIVRSKYGASYTNLSDFFLGWKEEINSLVSAPFMTKYLPTETELKEGIKTLKERKINKIKTALNGIEIDEKIYKNIFDAVNKMNVEFTLDKIGVSVGLYVPSIDAKESDWIKYCEIAQNSAILLKQQNLLLKELQKEVVRYRFQIREADCKSNDFKIENISKLSLPLSGLKKESMYHIYVQPTNTSFRFTKINTVFASECTISNMTTPFRINNMVNVDPYNVQTKSGGTMTIVCCVDVKIAATGGINAYACGKSRDIDGKFPYFGGSIHLESAENFINDGLLFARGSKDDLGGEIFVMCETFINNGQILSSFPGKIIIQCKRGKYVNRGVIQPKPTLIYVD